MYACKTKKKRLFTFTLKPNLILQPINRKKNKLEDVFVIPFLKPKK